MSFESAIGEMEAQQSDLPSYARYLNSLSLDPVNLENTIFVGAGDSLACAQFVERLMNFKPRSFDPYDLFRSPEIAHGKNVYFISVSGSTKSNIESATLLARNANKTIAITANSESQLAKTCSSTLPLKFTKLPSPTPGTNSFTASLLACSRLFGLVPEEFNLSEGIARAKKWADSHTENAKTVYFIANGYLFPIAMYGSLKVPEFSGERAEFQLTEEFSHTSLFTIDRKDLVIILGDGINDPTALKLSEQLNHNRYCAELLDLGIPFANRLENAIAYSIFFQYFALNMALRKGLVQPAFLENKELLQISNRMIYFD